MRIEFYLNNEEETNIHTMDMMSNPFKIGDVINLSVGDIPPSKLDSYPTKLSEKLVEENKIARNMFHRKEIKLIKEGKYIDIESNTFTIEYHCDLLS